MLHTILLQWHGQALSLIEKVGAKQQKDVHKSQLRYFPVVGSQIGIDRCLPFRLRLSLTEARGSCCGSAKIRFHLEKGSRFARRLTLASCSDPDQRKAVRSHRTPNGLQSFHFECSENEMTNAHRQIANDKSNADLRADFTTHTICPTTEMSFRT